MGKISYGWLTLTLSLVVGSLGIANLLLLFWIFILVILGTCVGALYIFRTPLAVYKSALSDSLIVVPSSRITSEAAEPAEKFHELTGHKEIDDQLQEIIIFILRDYVTSWYALISDHPEFIQETKSLLERVVSIFTSRCKAVDWTSFFTTRFVDLCASHVRLYRQAKAKKDTPDLVSAFFNLEEESEKFQISRRKVCTSNSSREVYFRELSGILCYLLLPPPDDCVRPIRLIVREILSQPIFHSVVELLSDPDFINQTIVWLCRDCPFASDVFLTVIQTSEHVDELLATQEKLNSEIAILRSRDLGADDDMHETKQQLNSLLFVQKLLKTRLSRLQEGSDVDSTGTFSREWYKIMLGKGARLFQLDLEDILRNSVAFSYFLEHVTNFGAQAYLFFCMNINSWKLATEEQLRAYDADPTNPKYEQLLVNMREVAQSIFDNYLSERAAPRLRLDESIYRKIQNRIKLEILSPSWFLDAEIAVKEKLNKEDRFLPSFKRDTSYIKLLAELDLLHYKDSAQESDDTTSWDNVSLGEGNNSASDSELVEVSPNDGNEDPVRGGTKLEVDVAGPEEPTAQVVVRPNDCVIKAEIIQKALVKGGLSSHASYVILVTKLYQEKEIEKWEVFRRYSDFYDFYGRINEQFPDLRSLEFPAKRRFNNLNHLFLERRLYLLNRYLQQLLSRRVLESHVGLKAQIMHFLDHGAYEHEKNPINKKVDKIVNPFLKGMTSIVRTVPDSIFGGIGKFLTLGQNPAKELPDLTDAFKVGTSLDPNDDNIPLSILLLLFDEVFEMRTRPAWLRRHIIGLLRDILHSLMGDVYNQKILEIVDSLTSPSSIAEAIKAFRNSLWPNGWRAVPQPPRDESTKMRTRVVAKASLLACLSDELTRIIGSETSRRGMTSVFDMLQYPELNRRLVFVLLESALEVIFQDQAMHMTFVKLYALS
ncbi:sorting nexin-13-like [Artemia franciscana]|uniref:sorting nexin-13-like n=1 Tax=Artemia franciscana TaxID=6661 RepID=UPI0032DB558C